MVAQHRSGPPSDSYNRSRQRLRSRQSAESEEEAAADAAAASHAIATAATLANQQWDGYSSPYLQQVMPGWRAGLTWRQLASCLSVLALIAGGLACAGFACWVGTTEIELDYTDCADTGATAAVCHLQLVVKANMTGPAYVYYALGRAYFNHRRIQTAWSMRQLLGLPPLANLTKQCRQLAYRAGLPVLPCGALPDVIFNDTVRILGPIEADNGTAVAAAAEIPLSAEGISWPSHTRSLYLPLKPELLSGTVQPSSWPAPAVRRYRRPFADAEDLHVWLQTPAFSDFRKMSHRVLTGGLAGGRYQLVIGYNYPVREFSGAKRIIVTDKSLLGGKNVALVLLPAATFVCYLLLCISTLVECRCRLRNRVT